MDRYSLALSSLPQGVPLRHRPPSVVLRPWDGEPSLAGINQKEDGLFSPHVVSTLARDHEKRRRDYNRHIQGLLIFTLWYGEYIRQHQAT
jgi:hypothetical protein